MSEIKAEGLRHVYSVGTPFEKVAIDNINVLIPHGQLVGIIGHTGSGKSTFIQHLNGLLKPTAGKVCCDGQDINASKQITHDVRFKVGLVFQYPEYQLFEETVYKDIAFGPKNMGQAEITTELLALDANGKYAAVLCSDGVKLFTQSMSPTGTGQNTAGVRDVAARLKGDVLLVSPSFAEIRSF